MWESSGSPHTLANLHRGVQAGNDSQPQRLQNVVRPRAGLRAGTGALLCAVLLQAVR